jgi:hypothetical protein
MKFVDLLGKELNVGDIVANATSCTGKGCLRRSILKRKYEENDRGGFDVKSLTIDKHWRGNYYVSCGNTSIGTIYNLYERYEHITLDVIRLGSLEEAFLPEEIELIKNSNIKINYE